MVKKPEKWGEETAAEALEKFLLMYYSSEESEGTDDPDLRDWLHRQEATFQTLVDKLAREVPPETPV